MSWTAICQQIGQSGQNRQIPKNIQSSESESEKKSENLNRQAAVNETEAYKRSSSPGRWFTCSEHCTVEQKVRSWIPSEATYSGYRFNPHLGCTREAANRCSSHINLSFSLPTPPSLPLSLKSIFKSILKWGLKKTNQLPANESPQPDSFKYEFYQTFQEELTPLFYKLFFKIQKEGRLQAHFLRPSLS